MGDIIIRWNHLRTPVILNPNFDNIPLACVLPDILHDHDIPCSAHLSASVKALQAAEANHHHDFSKNKLMS